MKAEKDKVRKEQKAERELLAKGKKARMCFTISSFIIHKFSLKKQHGMTCNALLDACALFHEMSSKHA